jgi:phosphoglycerol transferase MdoB-like AlkP superfamily enzyme
VTVQQENPKPSSEPASIFRPGGRYADSFRWILFLSFYAVLANLPFWIASRYLGILQNGWFCLDYIAVGVISLFAPRIVVTVLLLLAIAVDIVVGVSETYLLPIGNCFRNMGALGQFSVSRQFEITGVVLLALAAVIAAPFLAARIKRKNRTHAALCLIAFAIFSLSIDVVIVNRHAGGLINFTQPRQSLRNAIEADSFNQLTLSRIPLLRFALRRIFPTPSGFHMQSATALAMAFTQNIAAGKVGERPNLVIVLVESWGLDTQSAVSDALVQPYTQPGLLARYQVLQGTVHFFGPTLGGEGRELCGNTIGFGLMDASAQELQDCLPDRLVPLGYHNVAVHGMVGDMFDRTKWYKRIGFQETWFFLQFLKLGMPICPGPFPGMCDADVAKWIDHRLEEPTENPQFLYWVTLNSHLPVPVPSPLKAGAPCTFAPSLAREPALCSWYQLIANVHQSVADLAVSRLGRPTVFAIVGDHAPPFSNLTLRNQFSQSVVPYVLLVPRKEGLATK